MIFTATILISCVKTLLIPAYRSTDFEVHRNWMAITNSLPLKQWYFEDTSQWTLDYPPLFAYFEYVLSLVAGLFDKEMLRVDNLNYESRETVWFQRASVIVTDLVYAYGTYKCCSSLPKNWRNVVVLPILLITNCGLIMVDHIHFQYNGILYGILLISIAYMLQGSYLLAAFWFSVLLNMKHIYIYLAPAYFVFLLKNHCFKIPNLKSSVRNFFVLGAIVLTVFTLTYLPFADHIGQVFARLFPFKRGLSHAYWAPNFWAMYNTLDKFLSIVSRLLWKTDSEVVASMTGGLVQEFSHSVLPSVTPIVTMFLTGAMMLPALIKLWFVKQTAENFLRCLVLCALSSFLFGWHVHEKAILMVIIPLSILSVMNVEDAKVFLFVSVVGHYSLFPLLFPNSLLVVKLLLLILYSTYAFHSLLKVYQVRNCLFPLLNVFESLYIAGLAVIFMYEHIFHKLLWLNEKLPYLPLLLTSFYCSLGVFYAWIYYYRLFLTQSSMSAVKTKRKGQ